MKIGAIGSGHMGGTLGKLWAAKGHQVMFSSRDPHGEKMQALIQEAGSNAKAGTSQDAIAFGDVILLAVPFAEVEHILTQAGDLQNKIVIDATNRFDGQSAGMEVIRLAKHGRVVKAFHAVAWEVLGQPQFGPSRATIFITGDDEEAKQVVAQLCRDIGCDPLDVGGAENIPTIETVITPLWRLLLPRLGRDFSISILRR